MSEQSCTSRRIGSSPPARPAQRQMLARVLLVGFTPIAAYAVSRPHVESDVVGLAIAGAIPLLYGIIIALWQRRVDPIAVLASIGFALGCLGSLVFSGSSLPLKLHEALITFAIGITLLAAVLIRRPIPVARALRIPAASRQLESTLGALVGGFLVLHAMIHFALALSLPTASYLVASRVINWATLAIGALLLHPYVRRMRGR